MPIDSGESKGQASCECCRRREAREAAAKDVGAWASSLIQRVKRRYPNMVSSDVAREVEPGRPDSPESIEAALWEACERLYGAAVIDADRA